MQLPGPARLALSLSATSSPFPVPPNRTISGLVLKDSTGQPQKKENGAHWSHMEHTGATSMAATAAAGAPAGARDAPRTERPSPSPTPTVRPRGRVP